MNGSWLVVCGLALACSVASAQKSLETGNDFLRSLEEMERADRDGTRRDIVEHGNAMAVLNRVQGIRETNSIIRMMNESGKQPHVHIACVPQTVTNRQLLRVLKVDFEKRPELLHAPFTMLAHASLLRVFPC